MITQEVKYISDYKEDYERAIKEFGRTDYHSTGDENIDRYLGGGYGKKNAFEIVSIYGAPGVGKSMFGLRLLSHEILKGTKISAMFLEDDMGETLSRLENLVGMQKFNKMMKLKNLEILPEEATDDMWELDEVLKWIKAKLDYGIEIIYIDHLQFLYENDNADTKDQYQRHRIFIKQLNKLFKYSRATAIIISHVAKGTQNKGVHKMIGSSSLGGVVTKAIEITKDDEGDQYIELVKSRYTLDQVGNAMRVDLMKGKYV